MQTKMNLPEVLTAKEIQYFLNISKGKAYELFKEDGFPTILLGGNKRVYKDDFLEWIERQKNQRKET